MSTNPDPISSAALVGPNIRTAATGASATKNDSRNRIGSEAWIANPTASSGINLGSPRLSSMCSRVTAAAAPTTASSVTAPRTRSIIRIDTPPARLSRNAQALRRSPCDTPRHRPGAATLVLVWSERERADSLGTTRPPP
jgi:hypothetical protein